MKYNDLESLNGFLFEQMERLNGDLSVEQIETEVKRADAVTKVAKSIIDNANLALNAQKHFDEYGVERKVAIPLLGVGENAK